jgi:hypothetical protein
VVIAYCGPGRAAETLAWLILDGHQVAEVRETSCLPDEDSIVLVEDPVRLPVPDRVEFRGPPRRPPPDPEIRDPVVLARFGGPL